MPSASDQTETVPVFAGLRGVKVVLQHTLVTVRRHRRGYSSHSSVESWRYSFPFAPRSVSGNWRIIFRFENGNAYDVDLVDYH